MRRWCCHTFSPRPHFHLRLLSFSKPHLPKASHPTSSPRCLPKCDITQCFAYKFNSCSRLKECNICKGMEMLLLCFQSGMRLFLRFEVYLYSTWHPGDLSKYLKKWMNHVQRRQPKGHFRSQWNTLYQHLSDLNAWWHSTLSLLWPFFHATPWFSSYLLVVSSRSFLLVFHLPLKWWYLPPS